MAGVRSMSAPTRDRAGRKYFWTVGDEPVELEPRKETPLDRWIA